jgi:hypothetical protein
LGIVVKLYRPAGEGVGFRLVVLSIVDVLNPSELGCHGGRLVAGLPHGSTRKRPIQPFMPALICRPFVFVVAIGAIFAPRSSWMKSVGIDDPAGMDRFALPRHSPSPLLALPIIAGCCRGPLPAMGLTHP